ncbi:Lrp/AsnC family transcriptional regulator [Sphingomonas colocasiae]|uniref:Lrp/AsnC family transcriptional regulator n=1 Tax=Sphingomonas colocasiae TaxID=1848973 RepID=A0ABS7PVA1_9SPHN|nr:Lrp/AsnC family transcriptional regulator [Sphingomonas colocasiae]MBY8825208.1 Lrp/AsnC family transcriptional regulator [Sphingomonas colocasiae]
MTATPALDAYDLKILRTLSADGRITWSDLAEAIGLSLTPTIRRVRQLEEAGYISGYFAQLDEKRLAGGMIAFVSVTLEKQVRETLDAFEAGVIDLPEVMSGFLMSGGADYLLRSVVRDLDHYRDFLDRLTRLPGVAHIQSSFALNAFVNRPSPLITAMK